MSGASSLPVGRGISRVTPDLACSPLTTNTIHNTSTTTIYNLSPHFYYTMKIKMPKLFRKVRRGWKMRKCLSQPSLDMTPSTEQQPLRTLSGGRTKSYTTVSNNQVIIMPPTPAPLDLPPLNLLPTSLLDPAPKVHRRCSISTRCTSFVRKFAHPRSLPAPPAPREPSLRHGLGKRSLPQLYHPKIDQIFVLI